MIKKRNEKTSDGGFELGLGGMLKGFGDLVEKLGELAKAGEELSQTGEIHGPDKQVKGIYGFTVKVGLGDDGPRVEPFGNIRKDRVRPGSRPGPPAGPHAHAARQGPPPSRRPRQPVAYRRRRPAWRQPLHRVRRRAVPRPAPGRGLGRSEEHTA